jgi:ATP-dependent exoDNAse (exonuclease V) beta subunit
MNHDFNRPLLVLNASAGSGKTFNLVRNYLSLLLTEGEQKSDISNIIAMTFTNKASLEMKNRIIHDLDKLAYGTSQNDLKFREETAQFIGITPNQAQINANRVLKKILHQYEDFNVLTIDKFNLRLIRTFTRDLDLPENFEIVLEDTKIVELAIDELLSRVNVQTKNHIYNLVVQYAKENVTEETKWNVKASLIDDAKILTDEKYFAIVDELIQKEIHVGQLPKWKAELNLIKLQVIEQLNELRKRFHTVQPTADLYKNKSTTFNGILKIINLPFTSRSKLTDIEITDATIKNVQASIENGTETNFAPLFLSFALEVKKNHTDWFIRELQIKNFYYLQILRELALIMLEIRNRDSLIRVSEFNRLVANLVQNEDAPFIYERLGSRFRHFFLDEFQDTSRLQWLNLIPLVHNAIAQNDLNFIVGDPKQSIYRFKNGVAEQFVHLPGIYNPENNANLQEKSAYFEQMGNLKTLDDNWRSGKEIVAFNNTLFRLLRDFAPEQGKAHYQSITQNPKGKSGGYIVGNLLKLEKKTELTSAEKTIRSNELLGKWVGECIAEGYEPADICVLGKTKRECNAYAVYLKSLGYQVVSSDSLLLSSDPFVRLAIDFVRIKSNPGNDQYLMSFGLNYFQLFTENQVFSNYKACFELIAKNEKTFRLFSKTRFLEITGLPANLFDENYANIYALLTHFFRSLRIDILKNSYVFQLMDFAYNFDNLKGPDLLDFLNDFDKFGHKTNVSLPETKDSIQIMTAHKSKGLEFPVVMVPNIKFLSDRLDKVTTILEHDSGYFKSKLSKNSPIPAVADMSEVESESNFMDALNLTYVAFTRPIDRLYFGGNNEDAISSSILQIIEQHFSPVVTANQVEFEYGSKPSREVNSDTKIAFHTENLQDFLWFPEISLQPKKEFESEKLEEAQQIGKLFHGLMENALSEQTAKAKLEKLKRQGKVPHSFIETLNTYLELAFADAQFTDLIQSGAHLDEQTLIVSAYETLRPDKIIQSSERTIVLDFKTGEPLAKHKKQVAAYMSVLESMNLPNVSGFLYYVGGKGLIAVD